jgi:anti-anti-sigma regulatory factor
MTCCSGNAARFDPATDLRVSISADSDNRMRLLLCGAIDLHTAPRLRAAFDAAIRDTTDSLVIDAAGLAFGGADLVSALLHARAKLAESGRSLLVVNPPSFFRRVLAACQLEELAG